MTSIDDYTVDAIAHGCVGCAVILVFVWLSFMLAGVTIIMWRAVYA